MPDHQQIDVRLTIDGEATSLSIARAVENHIAGTTLYAESDDAYPATVVIDEAEVVAHGHFQQHAAQPLVEALERITDAAVTTLPFNRAELADFAARALADYRGRLVPPRGVEPIVLPSMLDDHHGQVAVNLQLDDRIVCVALVSDESDEYGKYRVEVGTPDGTLQLDGTEPGVYYVEPRVPTEAPR